MIKERVHDELWQDNETGEVITATQAISEFYKANAWDAQWTNYYTFTGLYSDTTIDAPDFKKAAASTHTSDGHRHQQQRRTRAGRSRT